MPGGTITNLLVNGNGTVGPRDWFLQDFATIDEAVGTAGQDNDRIEATSNSDVTTSFTLQDTPSDFGTMDSLSFAIRYYQTGRSDDTVALSVRIVNGATVLAAADSGGTFRIVNSNVVNTSPIDSTGSFAYVNTTANKAAWDAAELEIHQDHTQSMGGDGVRISVTSADFDGVYTPGAAPPNSGSASGSVAAAGSATGGRASAGSTTGTVSAAGSAAGSRISSGTTTGAVTASGSATGSAPAGGPNSGDAAGAVAADGSSTGSAPRGGTASGTLVAAGSATGSIAHQGSTTGAVTAIGSATGSQPGVIPNGFAAGSVLAAGSATGSRASSGAATLGGVVLTGSATGTAPSVGSAAGSAAGELTIVGSATGSRPASGSAQGAVDISGYAGLLVTPLRCPCRVRVLEVIP